MSAPPSEGSSTAQVVLWDVGNVLLHWDIRRLFGTVFDDPDEMEQFLAEVWTPAHNLRCDAGETFESVMAEPIARHPHYETQIRAAHDRWIETITGPVEGMESLLTELRDAGIPQYGLTNFSAETFPLVDHHPHFELLDGVVVSGRLGSVKPDPAIYREAVRLAGVPADATLFFDDSQENVDGALAVGIRAVRFEDSAQARATLCRHGLLTA